MKTVLITGCSSGFGLEIARYFLDRGWRVVATMRTPREDILPRSENLRILALDVTDPASIRRAIEDAGPIDVLVNNAGIGGQNARIEEIDEARFDRMFAVHAKGTFFCGKAVMPAMKAQRRGKIINTATRWALSGHETSSHYIAAKSAILGMTKAWAKELAPYNVMVNAVAPGGVWTDMVLKARGADFIRAEEKKVPLGRWAQPEEYGYLVAYLASPESDFVTGQVISPNGGATIVGF